jgi:hypothetical protein
MFRWLSRYVKRIDVYGVGIELREIPPEEALPLLAARPTPAPAPQSTTSTPDAPLPELARPAEAEAPIVLRQDFIRVSGTSASSQRAPRELDLMAEGDDIQVHVHPPDGSQAPMWVGRKALQAALDQWKGPASEDPISVPGRTRRKEGQVVFVVEEEGEVEVQAGWWIWVPRHDLKAALEVLGVRAPWHSEA